MASSVDVSVEAITEHQIREVRLDGQEIYVQPLSMSENLAKLAHKIDFSKDESEGKGKPTSEGDKEEKEEPKPVTPFQPSLWPWDSARNKLKAALTETSVLLDVLKITRAKKYMVLDAVQPSPPESRAAMHMFAKKKSLCIAAAILNGGGERLRKSQDIATKRGVPDFHVELFKLRQKWRLKKVGNTILGDLSFKSAGSRFWLGGTFEVTKSETETTIDLTDSPTPQPPMRPSSLQVTVTSELQGIAYIQVTIKQLEEATDLASAQLSLQGTMSGIVPPEAHWQSKLEAAHNVIFCREVFAQLAREAVQVKSPIPHIVIGNQIFLHLFPGIQLSIALHHYTSRDRDGNKSSHKSDNNPVLEHSLHQLLREMHRNQLCHPMPHPASALLGMSKRRRLAGPMAYSRSQIMENMTSELLLNQIIQHARHMVVRKKAIAVIDELAQTIQDPQISVHWSNLSTTTKSMLKVHVTSSGYENFRSGFSQTPFVLHLGDRGMRAVTKDGRVIELSHEEQELRDLILNQIAQHNTQTLSNLNKLLGWNTLATNPQIGVGNMEPIGNAYSLVMASPRGDRVLCIRSGPMTGMKVCVQRANLKKESDQDSSVVRNTKWQDLGGPFQEVDLHQMEGRNFCHKVELLMACLCPE